MEGIDLAGVVDSDFQGIQINFAQPRRFCQFSRGKTCFLRGGAHIPADKVADIVWTRRLARSPTSDVFFKITNCLPRE